MTALSPAGDVPRCLVLWFPDWPLRAALGAPPHPPAAILQAGIVIACSAQARDQGVRRGQRRRVAQGLAPGLTMIAADPERDARAFLPTLRLIEEQSPGTHLLRPGLAALRARGIARYHGGEQEAARSLLTALADSGYPEVRAGVADGLFAAELAARAAEEPSFVPPGHSRDFLAPIPVEVLDAPEIVPVLRRLGVRSLGQFAALPSRDVLDRFGPRGQHLHTLASGGDSRPVTPQTPAPELARGIDFDTPLAQADHLAFAVRRTADAVTHALDSAGLVCTEARIELTPQDGPIHSRVWLHPASFDAAELVDRVRWQFESFAPEGRHRTADAPHRQAASAAEDASTTGNGIVSVRIVPSAVDAAAHHQPGLFGQGSDQRLHHAVSRVQALLGHRGVLTIALSGGRWAQDRQVMTPWGERPIVERAPNSPWPGSTPAAPTEIFTPPRPLPVRTIEGAEIHIDERGTLSAPPGLVGQVPVVSWAGPWDIHDTLWDPRKTRHASRFQLLDARGRGWLAFLERGHWWAEGRYC